MKSALPDRGKIPFIQGTEFRLFGYDFCYSDAYQYFEKVKYVTVFDRTGIWKKVFGQLFRKVAE